MFLLKHPWFNAYRFNFSTNGLLYDTPKVQKYIWKNRGHVSIGISIDGNKTGTDLQRVHKERLGVVRRVIKYLPLWLRQMPDAGTKATFAHDGLPHLKDSIIALWDMGIGWWRPTWSSKICGRGRRRPLREPAQGARRSHHRQHAV